MENLTSTIVLDGHEQSVKVTITGENVRPVVGGGTLTFGQDQDGLGVGFEELESYSGYLSQLIIMNKTLTIDSMKRWTTKQNCELYSHSLFSFEENESSLHPNKVEIYKEQNKNIFFESYYPIFHLFDRNLPFHDSALLCNGLGGYVTLPNNKLENDRLFEVTSTSVKMCIPPIFAETNIWLGVEAIDGKPVESRTGRDLMFKNIHHEGPILQDHRICMGFFGCKVNATYWNSRWLRTHCLDKKKTVCQFDSFSLLTVRGLCSASPLDAKYYIDEESLNPILRGLTHSSIRYEDHGNGNLAWKIFHMNEVVAEIQNRTLSGCNYPVGKQTWHFKTNDCGNDEVETELLITSCGLGQFTCSDGTCINVTKKCDYEIDCEDETDEKFCNILIMPGKDIASLLPPPKLQHQSHFDVEIKTVLQRVVHLELETFSVTTDIEVELSWRDSRIMFANLKSLITANSVDLDETLKLWLPSFEIYGHNISSSTKTVKQSILRIRRDSGPVEDDISRLYEGVVIRNLRNTHTPFPLTL